MGASWKAGSPTIEAATKEKAGVISGTIVLAYQSETVEVTVDKAIEKLPMTDQDKADAARPLAESAIASIEGVSAPWKAGSPAVEAATKDKAGAIIGTIVLTCHSNNSGSDSE